MSQDLRLSLVVNYRRTNTYGHHAILGALDAEFPDGPYDVTFATGPERVADAILQAAQRADRVLVLWSFYSPDFLEARSGLEAILDRAPVDTALHFAGGVHASALPEVTLRAGWDLVAVGEGETTLTSLVRALVDGGRVDEVSGLAYLDDEGRLVTTGPPVREELDAFPAFAKRWHKFNPIEITRGCVFTCKFCQTPFMFKSRFRHRSVANIVEHVAEMRDRGLKDVRFITPTSLSYGSNDEGVDLGAVEELLSAVRHTVGDNGRVFFGSFPSEVRPEHVTVEALRVLKRYVNNDNLIIGAQSGSERILEESNRGHDVECIQRAVEIAVQEGFLPNVDFIFGLPSETNDEALESVALADRLTRLGARIHGHTFMPLPGTPYSNAEPGRIRADTMHALRRLESRGKLYGKWKQQERVAEQLVEFVRRPSR